MVRDLLGNVETLASVLVLVSASEDLAEDRVVAVG